MWQISCDIVATFTAINASRAHVLVNCSVCMQILDTIEK
jgi:hypothetical protein